MVATVTVIPPKQAAPADLERVFDLLKLAHAENGLAPMSHEKSWARLKTVSDHGALVVAMEDGLIVGCLGIEVVQFWYTDAMHFAEIFCFVHPDHRRAPHAKNMLKLADAAAKQWGLPLLCSVVSTDRTEGKCRLFRRVLKPVGEVFLGGKL